MSIDPNVAYWGDRCCKAEAEIERLRAALEKIADMDPDNRHLSIRQVQDIANVALEQSAPAIASVLLDPPLSVLALAKDMAGNELCWGADEAVLRRILRRCAEAAGIVVEQSAHITNGPTCHPDAFWTIPRSASSAGTYLAICSTCGKPAGHN